MATLQDYRNERLRKLSELKKLGVNPYPAKASRSHNIGDITLRFEELVGHTVTVVGRIKTLRKMGKIAFIVLKDASGSVQLFLKDGLVEPLNSENSQLGLEQINLLDSGDFIEATGPIIKTQTGEISVEVESLRILSKSLRPIPSEQEGFTNKEERLRRRYIDTNLNTEVYGRFIRRSKFWTATRNFLNEHGFYEINIPVLEHTTGGADANPFVTHMDALDQDFFLRISHELPLKKLLGGGYEKVYDLGPRFRNENYSDEHLPEHIAMEWYWAYADWQDGMNFMTSMYRHVIKETFGTLQFRLGNFDVDLEKDWEVWDYATVIKNRYGIDVFNCTIDEIKKSLVDNKLEVEKTENKARGIDKLWKNIRKDVAGPVWLVNTPLFISPLAKTNLDNPYTVQRFQPVIAGSELGNGYSELNDPIDQLNRFIEQESMRDAGDSEAMMLDIDFVEMLEYGMPPACGWGFSERVFWIFEGVSAREGVPFPQMRSEIDETTKKIYPNIDFTKAVKKTIPASSEDLKVLPISAAEHGTPKLYLDNYQLLDFDATVTRVMPGEEGSVHLLLDQTAFYPGGGGQPCDIGLLSWVDGIMRVSKTTKDADGLVTHSGVLEGLAPAPGTKILGSVDAETRLYHSRLHSAGHLIDLSVQQSGLNSWKPGKGAHYPGQSFVEYTGDFDVTTSENIRAVIEEHLNNIISKGGLVSPTRCTPEEARLRSKYIPEAILKMYQYVHVTKYPDDFYICCGGTHVNDVSEIGKVVITKVKKKDGNIRVSYSL